MLKNHEKTVEKSLKNKKISAKLKYRNSAADDSVEIVVTSEDFKYDDFGYFLSKAFFLLR